MKKFKIIMTAAAISAAMLTSCADSNGEDSYNNYLMTENISETDATSETEEFEDAFAEDSESESESETDNIISEKTSVETEIEEESSVETVTESSRTTEVPEETEPEKKTEYVVEESETIETNVEYEEKYVTLVDAPYISQAEYPTGCELVSASMLLKYYGFEVSTIELADKGYIQLVPLEKAADGNIYCADPNQAFIGDPCSSNGFGCYSGAIINGLSAYLADYYFDVVNLSGISLNDLCQEYIDFGEPVLIWATMDMIASEKRAQNTWIIRESGEEFSWLSNEHCLLLVGYDDENFYFNDPRRGAAVAYNRDIAQKRYEELGCQAVTIRPW